MRQLYVLGAAITVAVFGQSIFAKSLRDTHGPAELPPASYSASQYVDSTGCAFIRAGSSQWVPRVSRSRQVVCGQTPTSRAGVGNASYQHVLSSARSVLPVAAPDLSQFSPHRSQQVYGGQGQETPVSYQYKVAVPRSVSHGTPEYVLYSPVWTDGRLNPLRGLRNGSGS